MTTTMWMTVASGQAGVRDVSADDDQCFELLGVVQWNDEEEWIVRAVWCEARLVVHCNVSFVFACPKRWELPCLDVRDDQESANRLSGRSTLFISLICECEEG